MLALSLIASCSPLGGATSLDGLDDTPASPFDFRELFSFAERSKSDYDDPDQIRPAYRNLTYIGDLDEIDLLFSVEQDRRQRH